LQEQEQMTQTIQEQLAETGLAPFDPVRAEIERIRAENARLVFDYESRDGAKAARSHIAKLRKLNPALAEAHKAAKAEALKVCQTIDAYHRELRAEVAGMIAVHETPLNAIEEREALKAAELAMAQEAAERKAREEIELKQRELAAREAELRQREEEQQRQAREAQIAAEAEARAKQAAEARLAAERAEAERRVVAERAETERRVAEERRRAEQAIADERRRVQQETERQAAAERERIAAEQRRQADVAHRAQVEAQALEDLLQAVAFVPEDQIASAVLDAIKAGQVRHVVLNY
jgi:hypothetical protein